MVAASGVTPEYCKVNGTVTPVDPAAVAYKWQVDLPTVWNGKAMQHGGGGVNGRQIDPAKVPTLTAPDATQPLARGYTSFASDGGHESPDGSFALNTETFENFAGQELKKTKDVAVY